MQDRICNCAFQSQAGSPSTSHRQQHAQYSHLVVGFQSQAGSPSTSHPMYIMLIEINKLSFNPRREAPPRATSKLWYHCYELLIVSIPGGKPLHEPPTSVAFGQYYQSCVSIPGGKPLHEPPSSPVFSTEDNRMFQSQAGSPSTSHPPPPTRIGQARRRFNPRREAPPRATSGWLAALWERRRLAIREPEGFLACMGRLEESIAESMGFCKGHSGGLRSPFGRLPVFARQRAWRDHRCVPRKNWRSLE